MPLYNQINNASIDTINDLLINTNGSVVANWNQPQTGLLLFGNLTGVVNIFINSGGMLSVGVLGFLAAANSVNLNTTSNLNNYYQSIIQNVSTGSAASSDVIVCNNLSTDGTYYADLGINSSNFNGSGAINLPNAGYLINSNGDLVLATLTPNNFHIQVNANANTGDAIFISSGGAVTITGLLNYVPTSQTGVFLTSSQANATFYPLTNPSGYTSNAASLGFNNYVITGASTINISGSGSINTYSTTFITGQYSTGITGYIPYTGNIILNSGVQGGIARIKTFLPLSGNMIMNIYSVSTGNLLLTWTGDNVATQLFSEYSFTGTNWGLDNANFIT